MGKPITRVKEDVVNKAFREFTMKPFQKILPASEFETVAQETISRKLRKRKLTPEIIFWLIAVVGLYCDSMSLALKKAWNPLRPFVEGMPFRPSSEAALTKARKNLPLSFFKGIFAAILSYSAKTYPEGGLWKGLRVALVDGSTLNLPEAPELRKTFGNTFTQQAQSSAGVQARLVGLVCAFTGICVGFVWCALGMGEITALLQLVSVLGAGDLLLGDRGFHGYQMYCALLKQKAHFLFRLKKDRVPSSRESLGKQDWLVTLSSPKELKHLGLPETVTLRLIAFDLPGFGTLYLLTSLLDAKTYPREELIGLYPIRWQIETRYLEYKHRLEIENLRSHTTEGIIKELFSHMAMANLVRLVMCEAAEYSGVLATDLSFKHALEKVKDTIFFDAA